MSTAFFITAEGLVYGGTCRRFEINDAIMLFSKLLNSKSQAATFNALSQGINIKWALKDGIVNPFGDKRQAAVTVYTFDLDSDMLLFSDASQNLQLPLSRFRSERSVTRNDFSTFEPISPPQLNPLAFPSPYWRPSCAPSSRTLQFVTRILSDFTHQWRHILRHPYTDSTFRKLASAIVCIATLDFRTIELTSRWLHTHERGPYVWIHDLPSWLPSGDRFVRLGCTTVVLDQDLEHAMALAREDVKMNGTRDADGVTSIPPNISCVYILLSLRHIVLCCVNDQGEFSYTAPMALIDGIDVPSSVAIVLLLQGLSFASPPPRTRIHNFPIEIQDRILEHISDGSIEAARLGCLLHIGSPYIWMRPKDTSRRGGLIERHESPTHRSAATPVETQIWFEKTFSGLAYR
ncbi:hypothetical protein BGZ60DRAFT_393415 [Tricladium varicosporioides]|nr:hypothetical protein BGZ60DRAFT_393415 [Hymenoscyphus varicosporioides]